MDIKTASWFTEMPEGHIKIGISRGVPRRMTAGYRIFKPLAPGPWFNSVSAEEYYRLYRAEILQPLDPRVVASHLIDLARGSIPVMVCYERPGTGQWCHRSMAAEWLAEALGRPVPEIGFEAVPQADHPLFPPGSSRPIRAPAAAQPDLSSFIGREAMIQGQLHKVLELGADPGTAIVAVGEHQFPASAETVHRHFGKPAGAT